ncbi:hypothetical protein E8E12_004626 [Didymella heteroderae]|uniref:Uncharacterized protein n=1 Tax=Didymella heteroderae TaxID=1769908 RepID=A0A9P4WVY5_9PLEO|nr:hypothetical protein E8E12_004626 [Didymella heteroderae]
MSQANGSVSPERFIEPQPQRQSAVQIAIKNFSPVWFLISMDTGIISIIMNILPWQFNGLGIISTIMFVFNLVLFTTFSLLAITRLFTFPRHVKSESLNQVEEISYQGAPAIAGLFGSYNRGIWLTASSASSVSAASELIALMVLGFGFMWITVAWYMIIEAAVQRKMPYSLTWWSMIFPMGVYTTGLINLSIALDSDAFRGFAAALLIFLIILYLMNWGFTIWRLVTGVALGIPQQREEEDEEAKKKAKEEYERLYGFSAREREQRAQEENQQNGQSA